MGVYEVMKRSLIALKKQKEPNHPPQEINTVLSLPERMFSAAVSGMTCWMFIFPADVVRCRIHHQSCSSKPGESSTSLQMVKDIYTKQGMSGFFRGFGITVLRAGPVAAAVLPVYDLVLERLRDIDY